jgi:hypothetical protein
MAYKMKDGSVKEADTYLSVDICMHALAGGGKAKNFFEDI